MMQNNNRVEKSYESGKSRALYIISKSDKTEFEIRTKLRRNEYSEVIIDILNGDKVVTVLTTNSLEDLGLEVGLEVDAIIKASDIMIGK